VIRRKLAARRATVDRPAPDQQLGTLTATGPAGARPLHAGTPARSTRQFGRDEIAVLAPVVFCIASSRIFLNVSKSLHDSAIFSALNPNLR
jgi:hypothetical protein